MLLTLACFVAAVQAALVKVDADGEPLLVYVNGDYQGETPVILNFDPGTYRLTFKEDDRLSETMSYTLEVGRQSKGKVSVDWERDDVRVAWLEDTQRQAAPPPPTRYEEEEYDPLEEAERAALGDDRYDDDRYDDLPGDDLRYDDRGAQDEEAQRQAALEAARRLLAEEEARQRADAAARARSDEEERRRAAEQARLQAEAEARARAEAEEARRAAEAEARARAEEARRRAEEEARLRAEEEAKARYMPHREAGVAIMKEGDVHSALAEFRAAREAGDRDERIAKLIDKIERDTCAIDLTLVGADRDPPPKLELVPAEGKPFGPARSNRGVFRFADVPAGVPLTIRASGAGYGRIEVPVDPVGARKTGKVSAELPWLGLATLALQDFVPGLEVKVTDAMGSQSPAAAGSIKVTAGTVKVSLSGPTGRRDLVLELAQNDIESLTLKTEMPGAVRLVGLPAGTRVDMVVGPPGAVIKGSSTSREVVSQVLAGVPIGEELMLGGLPPGDYKLTLEHPVLGKSELKFHPVPGDASQESVLWESFSRAGAVRDEHEDWEARLEQSKKLPLATKLAMGGGGATLALAGAATAFGVRAAVQHSALDDTDTAYQAALEEDRAEEAWDLFSTWADQKQELRGARGLAIGGVGLAAAAGGASVTFWIKGRAQRSHVEDWDFWHLNAPGLPEPAAEPTPTPRVREQEKDKPEPEPEPEPGNELESEFGPMLQDLPDPDMFDNSDEDEE